MAGLQLKNVTKSFGALQVIKGVDLTISDGEFVVFVGPSGCGKSTLLRAISGLEDISSGQVFIDDQDVSDEDPANRGVAMVFQSYALYPHMNVEKNLGFGLRMGGMPKPDVDVRVQEAARILEISDLMKRKPKQLSGGQRQRVAIGRAIVRQPKVFLFDEPLSNLDAELRTQTRLEISRLHDNLKTTMVYVTHDQVEAMTLADKIVVLRDGQIEQLGRPIDLYNNPENRFVAGFIGSPKMNFLEAEVISVAGNKIQLHAPAFSQDQITVTTRHPDNANPGETVMLGVRPEHFFPTDPRDSRFRAQIQTVERLGGVSYLYCLGSGGSGQICVQENGHSTFEAGQEIGIDVDPAQCFLFGKEGERL